MAASSPSEATGAFEPLISDLDIPMIIVTASHEGQHAGCLVEYWAQASIRPRRVMVMISKLNHTYSVATKAPILAVHILRPSDVEIAKRFGEATGDTSDKFAGLRVVDGPGRAPIIEGLDWFAARVLQTFDLGDHVGFLCAPNDGVALRTGSGFYGSQSAKALEPGHAAD